MCSSDIEVCMVNTEVFTQMPVFHFEHTDLVITNVSSLRHSKYCHGTSLELQVGHLTALWIWSYSKSEFSMRLTCTHLQQKPKLD